MTHVFVIYTNDGVHFDAFTSLEKAKAKAESWHKDRRVTWKVDDDACCWSMYVGTEYSDGTIKDHYYYSIHQLGVM
jgi:hypothetical protein